MNRGSAWGLVLLVALTSSCVDFCQKCPTVYRVAGSADPKTAYNILFLGAGFQAGDLNTYRTIVQEYSDRLLVADEFKPLINVYRIDLTSGPVDQTLCPPSSAPGGCIADPVIAPATLPTVPLGPVVNPASGGSATSAIDLRAQHCWTDSGSGTGSCRVLWIDGAGEQKAFEVALCAPNISAVVVVANLRATAGGGRQDAHTAGVGLSVIGVPGEPFSLPGAVVGEKGPLLLEHELGHVLGLYDEYEEAIGTPSAPFRDGRNVWKPQTGSQPCANWVLASTLCPPRPWQELVCSACGNGLKECSGDSLTPGDCHWSHRMTLNPCVASGNPVGLWEGAYYQSSCYYRAHQNCRMSVLDDEMCSACQLQIRRVLCQFGSSPPPCPEPLSAACSKCP